MARNISQILVYDEASPPTQTFTINPLDDRMVDVDLWTVNNAQFLIEGTYAATASSTGLGAVIYYGFGGSDDDSVGPVPCVLDGASVPVFSSDYDTVTMSSFTPSSSNVIARTFLSMSDMRINVPRWIRIEITNTDPTNIVTIRIYADV